MSIINQPFTSTKLDEEKDDKYGKVFTMRLNKEQIDKCVERMMENE